MTNSRQEPPTGPMKRRQRYPAPLVCIFCSENEGETDEHIVPRGIGGELIIKNGTCWSCLRMIEGFEASLINNDFDIARVLLNLKSRKGRRVRDNALGFEATHPDGRQVKRKRQVRTKHSGVILFIGYEPPGIEMHRPFSAPFPEKFSCIAKCFAEVSPGGEVITHSPWNDLKFPRLLAKIAHCYWVAENGLGSFKPVLPPYILGDSEKGMGFFVGGYSGPSLPGNDLHCLRHGTRNTMLGLWGYVDIGLFSSHLPATNYRVFVGPLKFEATNYSS